MIQTLSVRRLHLEYRAWIAELTFYKELISIYEMNLQDIVSKNTDRDMLAQVEHFQNQFILRKEQIDELKHDLHTSEVQLATLAKDRSETGLSNLRLDNHPQLRQEVLYFRDAFTGLKEDFHRFESSVL